MRQELLWMPEGIDVGAYAKRCQVPYKGEVPSKLWTLYPHTSEATPPELPYTPIHNENAFLEDPHHDWRIVKEGLNYYSRVSEGGVWLLLEFKGTK
jgi:hypothetical protein